ncbi:MAG: hypothetical protein ACI4V5_03455 [Prevotella sp.]
MKKLLYILLFLAFTLTVSAQKGRISPEKFQKDLETYIISNANLTTSEAAKFSAIYNDMMSKQRVLHKQMKALKQAKCSDNASCRKNITMRDKLDKEKTDLQQTYHQQLLKSIPATKVHEILRAEDRFLRQAFRHAAGKK